MLLDRLAVLIGGFAAGALMRSWQAERRPVLRRPVSPARDWKTRVQDHEKRLERLEQQVSAQAAKLRECPSTAQITAAMDDLLANALSGLEARLTAQANSIETLQLTVSQTDELLERVLESLDTLQKE